MSEFEKSPSEVIFIYSTLIIFFESVNSVTAKSWMILKKYYFVGHIGSDDME